MAFGSLLVSGLGGSGGVLRSTSKARLIDVVSEGKIVGLVDGLKSVKLGGVNLQNNDDSYNFNGITFDVRLGTEDQEYLKGFTYVESDMAAGGQIKTTQPQVKTISNDDVDYVNIRIKTPSLTTQNQETGSVSGNSFTLKAEVQADGGDWVFARNITVSGKCTSAFEAGFRINKPEGALQEWSFRISRTTSDNESTSRSNDSYLQGYTEITDVRISYPNLALFGLEIDAEQFGGSIPARQYDIKGILVKVPENYDPETRAYTGLWNGDFKTEWTDNPAWILLDLLTNTRYGLGVKIKMADIDIAGLYTIAQRCDELVPNGFGEDEPRYTFNGVISTRKSAYSVLNHLTSTFNGATFFSAGKVYFTQDAPEDMSYIFHAGNVENGEFSYSSSAERTMYSSVNVSWNNPTDNYNLNVEVLQNTELLRKGIFNTKDIVAYGCTSRGQAHRFGKWFLESEREGCTFKVGLENMQIRPGNIIGVCDASYAGLELGGRIVESTEYTVTLDIEIEPTECSIVLEGETLLRRNVISREGKVVTVDEALPTLTVGRSWGINTADVQPRKFRVVSIAEEDAVSFVVNAVFHDETKYERIDRDIDFESIPYSVLPTGELQPPSDIVIKEYLYKQITAKSAVSIGWLASPDPRVLNYEVQYRPQSGGEFVSKITPQISIDVFDTLVEAYDIRVRSLSTNLNSRWISVVETLDLILDPPADVDGFGSAVIGTVIYLVWEKVQDLDLSHYEIRFSEKLEGANWYQSTKVGTASSEVGGTSLPARVGSYLIKAVDTTGHYSLKENITVNEISKVSALNVVEELIQNPNYTGVHDGTAVRPALQTLSGNVMSDWSEIVNINYLLFGTTSATGLRISGGNTMDHWTALDEIEIITFGTAEGFDEKAKYYFKENFVDLANTCISTVTATLHTYNESVEDLMANWDFLSEKEDIIGQHATGSTKAVIQVRHKTDTTAWSPWKDLIISELKARFYEFRVSFITTNIKITPVVTHASVVIDMPDRVEGKPDVLCPVEGLDVRYDYAFQLKPALTINAQDLDRGDLLIRHSESTTGFSLYFKNDADTRIARTFDWISAGYGLIDLEAN